MKRVGDFYASAMDSAAIDRLGAQPIKPHLDAIEKLSSKNAIARSHQLPAFARHRRYVLWNRRSAGREGCYQVHHQYRPGGTTLPDRDYYLKNDARNQKIRTEYSKYIVTLFKLCGWEECKAAMANAATILQLETAIANAQMSRVEMRDPVKLYNKFSVDGLSAKTPNLNWQNILAQLGYKTKQDSLVVSNPRFLVFIDSFAGNHFRCPN